jgi:hypothetical protein
MRFLWQLVESEGLLALPYRWLSARAVPVILTMRIERPGDLGAN